MNIHLVWVNHAERLGNTAVRVSNDRVRKLARCSSEGLNILYTATHMHDNINHTYQAV